MNINEEFIDLFKKADKGDKSAINKVCDYFSNGYFVMQTFDENLINFYKNSNGS